MSIIRSILSVALLVTLASGGPIIKNESNKIIRAETADYRLPQDIIKPTAYTIKLTPNLDPTKFTFKGESVIEITIYKGVKNQIKLHAKDLEIVKETATLVEVKDKDPKTYKPTTVKIDTVTDFLTLDFTDALIPGDYKLNLEYTGKLHDDMYGFYRSSYDNGKGENVYLATTQFEPTHARRAFPCFDEPAFKATFKITIIHEDKYHARSNTPEEGTAPVEGFPTKKATTFKVTPKMSTYLVAFIVSDFESQSSTDGKFRVWSKRNAIHNGVYAQEVGEKELKALEEYTAIPIPKEIGKMDNFAIPDFAAGAMENWGIVTYRERSLLFEEGVSTTAAKQSIATVISHEFAHQWFGNLVSPSWWEYTWLNEGFANYFQYVITDKVETKWRLMEQFVVENLQSSAFVADDDVDQHAMNVAVESPVQIKKIFDRISYQKAGSVIRMISHALTETLFKKGLTAYLTTLQYSAAKSDDLFNALSVNAPGAAGDLQLPIVLNTWATQAGYPVITVKLDTAKGKATITQKRFLSKKPATPRTEMWYIPITYATQGDPKFDDTKPNVWLANKESQEIDVTGLKADEWVIFNKHQTGYYRVNYDDTNWQLIIKALDSDDYKKIPEVNRAQLLDDSFNLAQVEEGPLDFKVFLQLSKYLERETDYIPWHAAFRAFSVLHKALANTAQYELFQLYVLRLSSTLEQNLNYTEVEDEHHLEKFNRINLINWACLFGSKQCREETTEKVYNHLYASEKISPDLRAVAFCAGLRDADQTVWDKAVEYYKSSKNGDERSALLNGLGCSSDTKILKSYLEKTLDPNETLSLQTALTTVSASSASGIDVALDFIIESYDKIVELDGNKNTTVVRSLKEIASRLTNKDQITRLTDLTKAKDIAEYLKASITQAEANVAWVKKNEEHIGTFLNEQKLVDPPKEEENKDKPDSSPTMSLPAISFIIFLALGAHFVSFAH